MILSRLRVLGFVLAVLAARTALRGQLVINEVLFDPAGVDTGNQVVEILNPDANDFHMGSSGYWLYFPPSSWQFPAGVIIPAGGTALIHINRPGVAGANEFFTGIGGMRSLRREDSLALYRRNLFGDSSEMVDFVQWGRAGQGGEEVAAGAGMWTAGEFVDLAALRSGASLSYDGSGNTAADWCIDGTPTLHAPNNACTAPVAQSPVILNEVGTIDPSTPGAHAGVELRNAGSTLEDLEGKRLVLGGQHVYEFPPGTLLRPGEILILHLGVDGAGGEFDLYTGAGTFRPLAAADALSFHDGAVLTDPTRMLDYIEWGAAGLPLENVADAAGRWNAGEFVNASERRPEGSLASRDPAVVGPEVVGADRWLVDNTPTLGEPNDTAPAPPVVINEVLIDPPGTNAFQGVVELRNLHPSASVNLGGYNLCLESTAAAGGSACFTFPEVSIQGGGLLLVRLRHPGFNPPPQDVFTGVFPNLDPVGGALSLFLSGATSAPNDLIDYLRWGDGPVEREPVAVEAGIWPVGDSVSVVGSRDDSSLAYIGRGNTSESYHVDRTPTIGAANDEDTRNEPFKRGDCNDDSEVNITDPVNLLNALFLGGRQSLCADACDANNDDSRDLSDGVFILNFLFRGGSVLAPPGLRCGIEEEPDTLNCDSYLSCP